TCGHRSISMGNPRFAKSAAYTPTSRPLAPPAMRMIALAAITAARRRGFTFSSAVDGGRLRFAGDRAEDAAIKQVADERSAGRHHAAHGAAEQPAAHHRHHDDLCQHPQDNAPERALDDGRAGQDADEDIRIDGWKD